ncbi:aldehyde dehydrogenase (NADP(+)) [Micrococcales bacterium 31B]|nr:aldehyde dehydrogenase (NADP(+)) [Micrococcales bacterium 31B]
MTATATATLDDLATSAWQAFRSVRHATLAERAAWLEAIAEALDAARDDLVPIAMRESHLPQARLEGEVARTTGQLRLFAAVLRDGGYLEATIDHEAGPLAPDLRRLLVPVGPVAVFSASNFPFAFSVAGGDTASALAAGCPVIVKAHSGHLELSRATAAVVSRALAAAGAPEGLFALVEGREVGVALVQHPRIAAVGFTGSVPGGRALFDLAQARPRPIPFYGELGSLNPVIVTPSAVAARGVELAQGLVGSFTLGVGQFCTKPGVILAPAGFADIVVTAAADAAQGGPQLNQRIADAYGTGLAALLDAGANLAWRGEAADGESAPAVLTVTADQVIAAPEALLEECFGPVTVIVEVSSDEQIEAVLDLIAGSLTGTVHAETAEEQSRYADLLGLIAGRILFSGWPTGVAVNWAQHHGGPYPASTNSLHTSVGATAIRRFVRPLAFQSAPVAVLPPVLQDAPGAELAGVPRRVDGALS